MTCLGVINGKGTPAKNASSQHFRATVSKCGKFIYAFPGHHREIEGKKEMSANELEGG